MSFFGVNVNPFSTPVGQKIEQATDSSLPSENWTLNMEICDIINETEDGPRDAIKAIKRRLNQAAGKNYTIVMYTLTRRDDARIDAFRMGTTGRSSMQSPIPDRAFSRNASLKSSLLGFLLSLVNVSNFPREMPYKMMKTASQSVQWFSRLARANRWTPTRDFILCYVEVLETCVKNCGKRFHTLACSREFVQELFKLIGPKNEPPTAVQEKVLSLIQTWADTFRHQPHTQGVVQVYQELKLKGIQFPMTDLDAMAPIITPERSVPELEQSIINASAVEQQSIAPLATQVQQTANQSSGQVAQLNEQQLAKLQSELDVVQGNMCVLLDMLAYFTSLDQSNNQQPDAADLELLTELHATCKAMQERVVELIGKLADDEMTAELLRINDELNNLFLRYSRFTKNKAVAASTILAQTIGHPANMDSASSGAKQEADSLIDLSDETDALERKMTGMGISESGDKSRIDRKEKKEGDNDEFDMFAQSRNASYETTKNSGSKYEDNLEQVSGGSLSTAILNRNNPENPQTASTVASTTATSLNRESEFNEMAAWLDHTPGAHGDQESLTSSEFERFLAERAAAAEALPTVPATTASTGNTTNSGSSNIQRQINKDQDKSLFAL